MHSLIGSPVAKPRVQKQIARRNANRIIMWSELLSVIHRLTFRLTLFTVIPLIHSRNDESYQRQKIQKIGRNPARYT